MSLLTTRPKISELTFGLYGRSIHPELFQIYTSRRIERDRFVAQIDVTSTGHLVMLKTDDRVFTEVATSAHQELPQRRRLLSTRIHDRFQDRMECEGGVLFEYQYHLERLSPESFEILQSAFANSSVVDGMLHQFQTSGRVNMAALSYMYVDTRVNSFRVQAVHTFPDDYAVLKTQSLYRLPAKSGI